MHNPLAVKHKIHEITSRAFLETCLIMRTLNKILGNGELQRPIAGWLPHVCPREPNSRLVVKELKLKFGAVDDKWVFLVDAIRYLIKG